MPVCVFLSENFIFPTYSMAIKSAERRPMALRASSMTYIRVWPSCVGGSCCRDGGASSRCSVVRRHRLERIARECIRDSTWCFRGDDHFVIDVTLSYPAESRRVKCRGIQWQLVRVEGNEFRAWHILRSSAISPRAMHRTSLTVASRHRTLTGAVAMIYDGVVLWPLLLLLTLSSLTSPVSNRITYTSTRTRL